MATFPRTAGALPRFATIPSFPNGLQSWAQSGKAQVRSVTNMGRMWTETYPVLDTSLASVRALIANINKSMREGTLWQVQHPYWGQTRLGAGGGTPLVNGASQSGSSLIIDGASAGITNYLRAGDIISLVVGPVLYDIMADVNTNGSGQATLTIHPPIFSGHSPADNAVVTIAAPFSFNARIANVVDFPVIDATQYVDAGMSITWREDLV